MDFEVVGQIRDIQTIAFGRAIWVLLRFDVLQEPIRRDFCAQALFLGGAEGAIAHRMR